MILLNPMPQPVIADRPPALTLGSSKRAEGDDFGLIFDRLVQGPDDAEYDAGVPADGGEASGVEDEDEDTTPDTGLAAGENAMPQPQNDAVVAGTSSDEALPADQPASATEIKVAAEKPVLVAANPTGADTGADGGAEGAGASDADAASTVEPPQPEVAGPVAAPEGDHETEGDGRGDGAQRPPGQVLAGPPEIAEPFSADAGRSAGDLPDAGQSQAAGAGTESRLLADVTAQLREAVPRHPGTTTLPSQFSLAGSGEAGMTFAFDADELGRLHFSFSGEGDNLRVSVLADRPETVDLLRRGAERLLQELRAAGYTAAQLDFGTWSEQRAKQMAREAAPQVETAPDAALTPEYGIKGSAGARMLMASGLDLRF